MKKFLLSLATLLSVGVMHADDLLYTCLFGTVYNSKKVSSYTDTFTATNDGSSWTIENFNNNSNGWAYVKCGRKGNASTGYIITDFAAPQAITKIDITIDAITASNVNSISLSTSASASGDYTEVESKTSGLSNGVLTFDLPSPAADLYYKLSFDCASGSGNGIIQISKVEYYGTTSNPDLKDAGLSYPETEVNVVRGIEYTLPVLTNPNNLLVSYSSSEPTVATVDDTTGAVTIVGIGTTIITAESAETTEYNAGKAQYTLTVTLKDPGIAFPGEGIEDYTGKLDETFDAPELTNPYELPVTYTSSNPKVATVDATTGAVTIVGYGATLITATTEATDTYSAGVAKYNILVPNPNVAVFSVDDLNLSNQTVVTNFDIKNSEGVKIATVEFAKGSGSTAPTYYTNGNAIRMYVNNTATIVMEAGWEIDYLKLDTPSGYGASGNYFDVPGSASDDHGSFSGDTWIPCGEHPVTSLVITNVSGEQLRFTGFELYFKAGAPALASADLKFSENEVSVVKGEDYTLPILDNPHGLTVIYSSSDEDVATVDADGVVTVIALGTTIITASSEKTDEYAAGKAEYTLTVTLPSAGLAYDGDGIVNYDVEFVDGKAEFTAPALHNPHNVPVTYSSTDENVATVDAEGAVTIVGLGVATISANFAGNNEYEAATASFTVTVFNPNAVEINFSDSKYKDWEITNTNDGAWTVGLVTFSFEKHSTSLSHVQDSQFRLYANDKMTISVPTGYQIDQIDFDFDSSKNFTTAQASVGTYTNKDNTQGVWTNSDNKRGLNSVTFTNPDQTRFNEIVISISKVAPFDFSSLPLPEVTMEPNPEINTENVGKVVFPTVEGIAFYYKWTPYKSETENVRVMRAASEPLEGFQLYTEPLTLDTLGDLEYYAEDEATGERSSIMPVDLDIMTGIVVVGADTAASVYYDLNGRRVNGQPVAGLYIVRQGNKTSKVIIK